MDQKALFLDRDGVVNIDYGYVYKKENFEFIDGIFNLVRQANNNNFIVFIITNQSGIARGYYSIDEFNTLTSWMMEQFDKQNAAIKKVYFCPYHPTEGKGMFLKDDSSRKPNPGMILQACSEYDLDLAGSILVGDKMSDIEAGERAGVGLNILLSRTVFTGGHECVSRLEDVLSHLSLVRF